MNDYRNKRWPEMDRIRELFRRVDRLLAETPEERRATQVAAARAYRSGARETVPVKDADSNAAE